MKLSTLNIKMVKITECVHKSIFKRRDFKCGAWRTKYKNNKVILSHYATEMLEIDLKNNSAKRAIGFESVSDKQGVNKVIRELDILPSKIKLIEADRGFRFE